MPAARGGCGLCPLCAWGLSSARAAALLEDLRLAEKPVATASDQADANSWQKLGFLLWISPFSEVNWGLERAESGFWPLLLQVAKCDQSTQVRRETFQSTKL